MDDYLFRVILKRTPMEGYLCHGPSWRVILVITLINRNLLSRAMEVYLSKDAHVGLFYKDAIRLF